MSQHTNVQFSTCPKTAVMNSSDLSENLSLTHRLILDYEIFNDVNFETTEINKNIIKEFTENLE